MLEQVRNSLAFCTGGTVQVIQYRYSKTVQVVRRVQLMHGNTVIQVQQDNFLFSSTHTHTQTRIVHVHVVSYLFSTVLIKRWWFISVIVIDTINSNSVVNTVLYVYTAH